MPERLVLCGDVQRIGVDDPLRLAIHGKDKNITFETDHIRVRLGASVSDRLLDLIEIATYIYCADQATGRGGNVQAHMGAAWRRDFRFVIPVRDPDHWSHADIIECLRSTVSFLSDDNYEFEFESMSDRPLIQTYLPFDGSDGVTFNPDMVALFSGGLDSLAGAIEELAAKNGRIALVSHRSSVKVFDHQKRIVQKLSERFPKQILHIPILVTRQEDLPVKDYTQRSRSFLYAALACAVGHILGINKVRFFENGVVSINLPISEQVIGGRATRTTHPRVIKTFREFFSVALASAVDIDNPFVWRTKKDIVQTIVENGGSELINDSVSCTRVHEMTKLNTHCGRCSQCIDRRFAILAAKAEAHDASEKYRCDLLTSARDDEIDRTMAESYVRTAVNISGMNDVAFFGQFGGEAARLLDCFPSMRPDDVGRGVYDLHQRHAEDVTRVLADAVAAQSADLIAQRLPASSLLVMSVSQGVVATPAVPEESRTLSDPWNKDAPLQFTEPLSSSPEFLQLALHQETGDVVIRDVTRLTGTDSKLIRALEVIYREDRVAERTPENHQYITAEKLANKLKFQDVVAARQCVSRCRKEVEEAFEVVHGHKLPSGSLIQTRRPDGYRLNPQIRFVSIKEIDPSPPVSRSKQKPVT
jgi:hypothetical protein